MTDLEKLQAWWDLVVGSSMPSTSTEVLDRLLVGSIDTNAAGIVYAVLRAEGL